LGRRPLGAVLHSSNEPGELSQWLCHDGSTINIAVLIIIIIIIKRKDTKILNYISKRHRNRIDTLNVVTYSRTKLQHRTFLCDMLSLYINYYWYSIVVQIYYIAGLKTRPLKTGLLS